MVSSLLPLPAKPWKGRGRPPRRLRRHKKHGPVWVKELALALPSSAWKDVGWREGSQRTLCSRFAPVRVRPAHPHHCQAEAHPEEWLLIEWPGGEPELAQYWLSRLPAETPLKHLPRRAKHRRTMERDYEELKQELGLGHSKGQNRRGFHHHAALCIAAARTAACAWSGIIRARSPRSESPLHAICPGSFVPAFSVAPHFYDTVVLAKAPDLRSGARQFPLDALVAPVDVIDAVDDCFALGDQRGQHQRSAGAQVRGQHGRSG